MTDWMCTFDMGWYPFGIQKCDMRFYVVEEDIKLVPKNIMFNGKLSIITSELAVSLFLYVIIAGPRHVGMFSFRGMESCQLASVADNHQGILVETFLYRPLLVNILSQFLPTLLFLLIRSHIKTNNLTKNILFS